jgi:hypothetical protein
MFFNKFQQKLLRDFFSILFFRSIRIFYFTLQYLRFASNNVSQALRNLIFAALSASSLFHKCTRGRGGGGMLQDPSKQVFKDLVNKNAIKHLTFKPHENARPHPRFFVNI